MTIIKIVARVFSIFVEEIKLWFLRDTQEVWGSFLGAVMLGITQVTSRLGASNVTPGSIQGLPIGLYLAELRGQYSAKDRIRTCIIYSLKLYSHS